MKTFVTKTAEGIKEYFDSLTTSEAVNLHNEYCQEMNYHDDEIYYNDENFFSTYFSEPMEAVRAVHFGEYRYNDEFIKFNGYGNLETFNDPTGHIDTEAIINAILEGDFCPYDVELEEPEEQEETEE